MDIKNVQERVYGLKKLLDPSRIEREKRAERKKGIVRGLMIGTFIGGLIGIFLSPDTGENNRKKAKEEIEKIKATLETNLEEGKEKLSEIVEGKREVLGKGIVSVSNKIKYGQTFDEDSDAEIEG